MKEYQGSSDVTGKILNDHVYGRKMKSGAKILVSILHLTIRKNTYTQCSGSRDFLEITALLGQI